MRVYEVRKHDLQLVDYECVYALCEVEVSVYAGLVKSLSDHSVVGGTTTTYCIE